MISTPHHLHYAQARDALEAGAHVLCEKPMTLDPAEAWDLVDRARAARRHLLVANGYQYLPHVAELRGMIRDGAIGAIETVQATFVSATRNVFHGARGQESWKTTFFRPDRATWQDPARGGGFAYGQMSHSIALICWLTGLLPRRVAAQCHWRDGVDLGVSASVGFACGAVGSLTGAAAMPQGNRGMMRLVVAGREGMLSAEFDRDLCEIRREDGSVRRIEIAPGDWIYHCRGPVEALADLAGGADRARNQSPGETGATTVATIAALLASAAADGAPQTVLRAEAPA